jgi:hypothetical protein
MPGLGSQAASPKEVGVPARGHEQRKGLQVENGGPMLSKSKGQAGKGAAHSLNHDLKQL